MTVRRIVEGYLPRCDNSLNLFSWFMARIKVKPEYRCCYRFASLLASASLITAFFSDSWDGQAEIAVGNVTPAISVAESMGSFLLPDGSLWSWDRTFLAGRF